MEWRCHVATANGLVGSLEYLSGAHIRLSLPTKVRVGNVFVAVQMVDMAAGSVGRSVSVKG